MPLVVSGSADAQGPKVSSEAAEGRWEDWKVSRRRTDVMRKGFSGLDKQIYVTRLLVDILYSYCLCIFVHDSKSTYDIIIALKNHGMLWLCDTLVHANGKYATKQWNKHIDQRIKTQIYGGHIRTWHRKDVSPFLRGLAAGRLGGWTTLGLYLPRLFDAP